MSAKMIPVIKAGFMWLGKWHAPEETNFSVEVIKGKSISIFQNGEFKNLFGIGDQATYDAYNLIYTGEITKITEKTVTIVAYKDTPNAEVKRLPMYNFCWRNVNFDLEQVMAHNYAESMCI